MAAERARSVLIVEDERIVAMDLQQSLAAMGYDAFAIAASAEEAIKRVTERCPDVILMDIRIKGPRDAVDVPIVYLTAHADEATIARAKLTQPHGYLVKPVKTAELRSTIELSLYRHETERRLRERERWFATTLRSIGDAVITADLAGQVTFMNPAAEALAGVASGDALGRPASELIPRITGDPSRTIREHTTPVVEDGHVLGAVTVFRDVTQQRRMERQLEVTDRLASLGTMAAGVAHQINNPLAVVIANADFVRGEIDTVAEAFAASDPGLAGHLRELAAVHGEITDAGGRISKVVADLNSFARPGELPSGEADIAHALEWAVRATGHELRARARLTIDVAALPPALADELRLRQVFVNLLRNAAQAIGRGGSETNEIVVRGHADDTDIHLELRDTGGGIDPADLPRIFEPFFTTRAVGEGAGLGLSVCHGIVTSMGGQLEVDSELGRGTTVRIVLRRVPPTLPGSLVATGARPRILAVDDDPLVHRTLQRLLRDHELVCVSDATDALARLDRGERYDLIFSDLMMPVMTGMELYEQLMRRDPEVAHRVVFVTGGALMSGRCGEFLRSVPNAVLEKPFGRAEVHAMVNRMLGDPRAPVTR